ncbi:hypothetical protein ACXX9E_15725 [Pseudomonas sp. GNP014]
MSWECVSYWIEHHPGLASWVQAFGSIGAIIAAGYFPIAHEKARERRDRRNVLKTLIYLAEPLESHLQKLSKSLLETDYQKRWIASDGPKELRIIGNALMELPASMVVAFEVTLLTDLRLAHECAAEIDTYLHETKSAAQVIRMENLEYYNVCENSVSRVQAIKKALLGMI